MRDVSLWLAFPDIYTHNGASFFFIVVYAQYIPWICITPHIQFIALRYLLWRLGNHFLLNDWLSPS
jgi:hypothetical protein